MIRGGACGRNPQLEHGPAIQMALHWLHSSKRDLE
jgi:hypothetical protein